MAIIIIGGITPRKTQPPFIKYHVVWEARTSCQRTQNRLNQPNSTYFRNTKRIGSRSGASGSQGWDNYTNTWELDQLETNEKKDNKYNIRHEQNKNKVGNIIIGNSELMYLIQRINLPSIEAIQMTALGNKKNINRGKYFSVDKILKEHTIKNTKIGHSLYTETTMVLTQIWLCSAKTVVLMWYRQNLRYLHYISMKMESHQPIGNTRTCNGIKWDFR